MKRIGMVLLLLAAFAMGSCNIIFPPLRGRENPDDPKYEGDGYSSLYIATAPPLFGDLNLSRLSSGLSAAPGETAGADIHVKVSSLVLELPALND